MTLLRMLVVGLLTATFGQAVSVSAQLELPQEKSIRFGRMPALSYDGTKVCFSYQGNLWVNNTTGGVASRLTASDSTDLNPHWSPDGNWIAFNSDREGGNKVFIIPSRGGSARQITFHSAPILVADWYPDGKSLLVTTNRNTNFASIYKLDILSGRLTLLFTDSVKVMSPTLSPDGKWIAWSRGFLADTIRKNYKGAANYSIYTAPSDFKTAPKKVSDSDKNNMWPAWSKDSGSVYYCSERNGVMTVFHVNRDGGKPTQVVSNPPDAIRYLSSAKNAALLTYECDNKVCTTPTAGGKVTELNTICRTDDKSKAKSFTTFSNSSVSEYALSPDSKKVALVIRGDVFLANTDKPGEAKRLTDTPARESNVKWMPDGKSIVFASSRTGVSKIYSLEIATKETRQLSRMPGADTFPIPSPDGKWIAFLRSPKTGVALVKSDGSGEKSLIDGPGIEMISWAPDGKWLLFARPNEMRVEDIFAAKISPLEGSLVAETPVNITDHPAFNDMPKWAPDGTKVAYRSNRYRNRDIETINNEGKYSIYTTSLEKDKDKFDDDDDSAKPAEKKTDTKVVVKIDPTEIERRGKSVVAPENGADQFEISPDSKTIAYVTRVEGRSDIWSSSVEGGSPTRLTQTGENPTALHWSSDSSKIYYLSSGSVKWVSKAGQGGGAVAFTARMEIDRIVDFKAVFDEAWQNFNDTYYDPTFHGVDWKAIGAKYRDLIDSVSARSDFDYMMVQLFGELNSSHTGFGNPSAAKPSRQTGYIGAVLDPSYTGKGLAVGSIVSRSPADKTESKLNVGDIIISVDDTTVNDEATYDQALTDKVGKTVTLTVNNKPTIEGARKVKIKPIGQLAWRDLIYEKWVDERRALVEKLSGGRIGYTHVIDMGDEARNRFERELFSVGNRKEAMIVDVRNNNGGDTHDSLLRMVSRNKKYFTFTFRNDPPLQQPDRAFSKPLILLTNPGSLSDAECFSNGWRELGIGKIVGQPTMGWIIFTGTLSLLDGSFMRMPRMGCFTNSGKDMENWGVPPDIFSELAPEEFMAGTDSQIARAVEELLKDKRLTRE